MQDDFVLSSRVRPPIDAMEPLTRGTFQFQVGEIPKAAQPACHVDFGPRLKLLAKLLDHRRRQLSWLVEVEKLFDFLQGEELNTSVTEPAGRAYGFRFGCQ